MISSLAKPSVKGRCPVAAGSLGRWQTSVCLRSVSSNATESPNQPKPPAEAHPRHAGPLWGKTDDFLSSDASRFLEDMMSRWTAAPESVHPTWQKYFQHMERGRDSVDALAEVLAAYMLPLNGNGGGDVKDDARNQELVRTTAKVIAMVRSFQVRGHLRADVDPLKLPARPPYCTYTREQELKNSGLLSLESFGFSEADLDLPIAVKLPQYTGFLGTWEMSAEDRMEHAAGGFVATLPANESPDKVWTLRDLYRRLNETYCGSIGVEFVHISDHDKCNFLRQHFETPEQFKFSNTMKRRILHRTIRSVLFETFAAQKFSTLKRFGLDGCETLITGMKSLAKLGTLAGVESVLIGMAHRGRLNTLHNVMRKPANQVFSEFQGNTAFGGYDWGNLGDVKYHMGVEYEYVDPDNRRHILMTVLPNPSHLEAVDPVVLGMSKARINLRSAADSSKVLPVLIHGDASIAGQGVVYETSQMQNVPAYSVGGSIHIVVNNQIGFTTNVADGCSGVYCTDLAKAIGAPIFHVNADDPEAVTYAVEVALKYRQKFKSDVFIDLIGYRRYGHNELDMPKFTQPHMYDLIDKHPTVLDVYSKKLIAEGVITEEEFTKERDSIWNHYDSNYRKAKEFVPSKTLRPFSPQWNAVTTPDQVSCPRLTGVPEDALVNIGKALATLPSDFSAHPTIARVYKQRLGAIESGQGIDFGFAEALAFGSLLREGHHIRLAGQDVERGTFSHRHAVVHDQKTNATYCPLQDFASSRHYPYNIEIKNSILSEFACLGFEYGYSLESPQILNIWEAQFGDFANGAQVPIDQFISSAEVKWKNQSGITVLLPHGYDGQGPEHSSARIERYLQLCDDREDIISPIFWKVQQRSVIQKHNIQVCNVTSAANFFHVLRRQMHRGFRKPLIVFSPKKLLRLRESMSPLREFVEGTRFARYIHDPTFELPEKKEGDIGRGVGESIDNAKTHTRENVKRLVLCSGQVYYDLVKARQQAKVEDQIMIARVEQLSPFPFDQVANEFSNLLNLETVVWAQEEPMNQGPWGYASKRIEAVLRHLKHPNKIQKVIFIGRDVAGSTAVGDVKLHAEEQARLCSEAVDLSRSQNSYVEKYM
eukprot:Gregarina_sp_Poly_1__7698@NODE_433_length_8455_cov_489_751192_g353_i0_p2_GENE_NODE_433_length_8455_cov_489_751192_g353_i0NODE_433_length_8455_cov_489_751192_g353_i0_p2_ORF_typecomplete_len1104_score172_79E1_dh/PF00676_20/7e75Transket_pyr/PF02779_24/1_6e48Transket_pyr/PF02779_24/3_8e02OxoGdeHyase_C/PF16870_5/2_1e462oxogl_dehyd_N/PF16078_5/7_9e08SHOCT/PF09851_9/1_1_NODE_433_length_8455_cov_489_751192_g353_i05293840